MGRFVVTRSPGPASDRARGTREQTGWPAHAAFMDSLADERVIAFGGPAGDRGDVVLVVDAPDEAKVRARLAGDPWPQEMLRTIAIQPWSVWLGGDERLLAAGPAPTLQLVAERAGPRWDPGRSRREQAGWANHGAFMDALVADGAILLGGPVSDTEALLVMAEHDEAAVAATLADDPWLSGADAGTLEIASVRAWALWLRPRGRDPV